jgi:hypothetical protein
MIKEQTVLARALAGSSGSDDKQYPTARVEFEILAGPDQGQRITYNGRIDARSAPYVAKDLKAVGWKGRDINTLATDVEAAKAETTIEIQHKQTKDGSRTFPVVRSIGRGAKPLAPLSKRDLDDANAALLGALESDGEEAPF